MDGRILQNIGRTGETHSTQIVRQEFAKETQLQTLLKEIESAINSRPLVYVGDDIESNITLTP